MASTALGALATDNGQLPLGHELNFRFENVTATVVSNNPERLKCVFVVPFDCFIETVAVTCNDFTAASTVAVNVTCAGILDAIPVVVNATGVGSGINKLGRLLYDNTKASAALIYTSVNPALRVLLKGATVQLNVSTTNAATPSSMQVALLLRSTFNRG